MSNGLLNRCFFPFLFAFSSIQSEAGEIITRLETYQRCVYAACEANKRERGLPDQAAGALAYDECSYERNNLIALYPVEQRDALVKRLREAQVRFVAERNEMREFGRTTGQRAALRMIADQKRERSEEVR